MERFPDRESCIAPWNVYVGVEHLFVGNVRVNVIGKKAEGVGRVERWHCHDCKTSFKVTCGTVFHGRKIEFQ